MKLTGVAGLAALCVITPMAFADPPPVVEAVTEPPLAQASTLAADAPEADAALDVAELDGLRGGDIVIQDSSQTFNAVNRGNTVNGQTVDSGAMNINANAFAGYDGIGNFVMNTGHNNNLMGSVSVIVTVPAQ